MAEKNLKTLYVELDVLLDTRLGTVARLDQTIAAQVLEANYHIRDTDEFAGLDMKAYKDLYAKRDTLTLAYSIFTGAVGLLRTLAAELNEEAVVRPYHNGCRIVVNMYPYTLTPQEQEELGKVLVVRTHGIAPIELTSISPAELTPKYCKKHYALMLKYDYQDWLEMHAKAFEKTRLPSVTLLVPAIYFNEKPTEEQMYEVLTNTMHPWQAAEMLFSPLVGLKLIDVKYFSIVEGHETA